MLKLKKIEPLVHKKKTIGRHAIAACGAKVGKHSPAPLIAGVSYVFTLDGKTGKKLGGHGYKKITCGNCLRIKKVQHKPLGPETNDVLRSLTKSGNLKKGEYGALCYVVIANYQGKGRDRVICHEVELDNKGGYSYSHRRTWNFPVK